jgi:hypothetical protein
MNDCGYCTQSLRLLQAEILKGAIITKDSTEAPVGTSVFPFFVNTVNNNTTSGLPKSVNELYDSLNNTKTKETYERECDSTRWSGIYILLAIVFIIAIGMAYLT